MSSDLDYEKEVLSFEFEKKVLAKDDKKWDLTKMQKIFFSQKCQKEPSFFRVFNPKYNMTKEMREEFRYRTYGERNITVEIIGQTGSGKSSVLITLALNWFSKPVDINDIVFTTQEVIDRAKLVGRNHTIIKDEQNKQKGMGSQREEDELEALEDTTRKYGLNLLFASPRRRNHSSAHYLLEVICINKEKRLTKVAIYNQDTYSYIGYFVIKIIEENNKLWKEYNKKKDKFIETVLSRQIERLSLDEMSKELKKSKKFPFCKSNSDLEIIAMETFPTLTTQEIKAVVNNFRILERVKNNEKFQETNYLDD